MMTHITTGAWHGVLLGLLALLLRSGGVSSGGIALVVCVMVGVLTACYTINLILTEVEE